MDEPVSEASVLSHSSFDIFECCSQEAGSSPKSDNNSNARPFIDPESPDVLICSPTRKSFYSSRRSNKAYYYSGNEHRSIADCSTQEIFGQSIDLDDESSILEVTRPLVSSDIISRNKHGRSIADSSARDIFCQGIDYKDDCSILQATRPLVSSEVVSSEESNGETLDGTSETNGQYINYDDDCCILDESRQPSMSNETKFLGKSSQLSRFSAVSTKNEFNKLNKTKSQKSDIRDYFGQSTSRTSQSSTFYSSQNSSKLPQHPISEKSSYKELQDEDLTDRRKLLNEMLSQSFKKKRAGGYITSMKNAEHERLKAHASDVIRKREDRQRMHGAACPCCTGYYDVLELSPASKARRIDQVSRHRYVEIPVPKTPEHYWDIGFPTDSELRSRGLIKDASPGNPSMENRVARKLF